MKRFLLGVVRSRHVWGLYFVNLVFQKILRITSQKVLALHFSNVISADAGFELFGEGQFAEQCLRINGGILIQASNGVKMHRSVLIGPGIKIVSGNHDLNDFSKPCPLEDGIVLERDCWIGSNSVILPNVHLLPGTIVGAGSVVTKSFGVGNVVVAGNPAVILRKK